MSASTASRTNIVRTLRRWLGGSDRFSATPFADLDRAYKIAANNIRYFYLASALYLWLKIPVLHEMVDSAPPLDLAWPLIWADGLEMLPLVDTLSVTCAFFSIFAFWKPHVVWWRAGFAVTFLMCAAVPVSLGAINHGYHEWIWVASLFILLPNSKEKNPNRATKMSTLITFAGVQGLMLMFYTMAGFWKALSGVQSLIAGVPGNFSPNALAWTLADRMLQTNSEPLLGPFMVENAWVGWPAFMFIIYAQVVAIAVVFRPSLHRAWALALIAFHTGTFVLMQIAFPTHIAILMVLFLLSPFQREDWLRFETLYHLPIFGDLARRLSDRAAPSPSQTPVPEAA